MKHSQSSLHKKSPGLSAQSKRITQSATCREQPRGVAMEGVCTGPNKEGGTLTQPGKTSGDREASLRGCFAVSTKPKEGNMMNTSAANALASRPVSRDVKLSTGAIVWHKRLPNGAQEAIIDGREMSHEEWEEYCAVIRQ